MAKLWCETEGISIRDDGQRVGLGSTGAYETSADTPGELYRLCTREYGRCTGAVYVDQKSGPTLKVGWVFVARRPYEDDSSKSSIIETWVTVLEGPDTVTRRKHYARLTPEPRQKYIRRLSCTCARRIDPNTGQRGMKPDTYTCGACYFKWCGRCHPTPAARCPNEENHKEN